MSSKITRLLIVGAMVFLLAVLSFPITLKKDRLFPYGAHEPELVRLPFAIAVIRLILDGNKGLVDYLPGEVSLNFTNVMGKTAPTADYTKLFEFNMPPENARSVWLQLQKKNIDRVDIEVYEGTVFEAHKNTKVSRTATDVTWNGSTHDGNLVQLTARLPSTLIVMIAGPAGVVTISPNVYSNNYLLRIEPLEQAGRKEQNALSKRGIVVPDCDVAPPITNPVVINAALYLSPASQGKMAISKSLNETQIVNLNNSLARSRINAQVDVSDMWILDDQSAAFNALSADINCSSIEAISSKSPESVDSLQRMVRRNGYDIGFFVMRMDLGCGEKETPEKRAGGEPRKQTPTNEKALCGVAYQVDATDRDRSGIALLDGQCFSETGGLLAHEFGHLVGARHEIYNDHEGERGNHGTVAYVSKNGPKQACVVQDAYGRPKIPGVDRCDLSGRHTATIDSSGYYSNRIPAFSSPAIRCNGNTDHEDIKADNAKFIGEYLAALKDMAVPQKPETTTPPPPPGPPATRTSGLCESFPRTKDTTCDSFRRDPSILFNIGTANYRDDDAARSVIELMDGEARRVVVRGFSSQSGDREYNLGLSLRRANKVADDIRAMRPAYEVATCAYGREFADCFKDENDAMRAQISPVDQ